MLVTPNRMIMAPGSQRSIRVVSLDPDITQDRVYRVLVSPAVGELAADTAPEGGRGLAIKILTAFDILVVVRPNGSKAEITAERTPTQVTIQNKGNTNALLYDGLVCNAGVSEGEGCLDIPVTRLYAGRDLVVPLASSDQTVILRQRTHVSDEPINLTF